MLRLFRQFSSPGGIPSHVSVTTPGSIHEGGELGYVLVHAFGAVMDNPDLLAIAVVGDGEAETGPLEGSWKGVSFINPARDGAVLPILHLNDAKISGPTVLGRKDPAEVRSLLHGHGYDVIEVEGADLPGMHHRFAAALAGAWQKIRAIQIAARAGDWDGQRPRWPLIVLRSPKGWTGPDKVDGIKVTGTWRSHQVPLSGVRDNPEHLADPGAVAALVPAGGALRRRRRAGRRHPRPGPARRPADERQPARQRRAAHRGPGPAGLPGLRGRGAAPGRVAGRVDPQARRDDARHLHPQPGPVPAVLPGRDQQQPARRGVRGLRPRLHGAGDAGGRGDQPRRPGDGGAVRAQLPRLAGGLHADRPARHVRHLRGVRDGQRVADGAARQVAAGGPAPAVAGQGAQPERAAHLDRVAQRPQRLLAPGAGPDPGGADPARRRRPGLPAAGRQLPAVGGGPLLPVPLVHQSDRHRQAAAAAVPDHGRGHRALRPRRRDLGVGRHRRRHQRPGHRAGLRR